LCRNKQSGNATSLLLGFFGLNSLLLSACFSWHPSMPKKMT